MDNVAVVRTVEGLWEWGKLDEPSSISPKGSTRTQLA
jgi:hypothetical protein